ncbi:MAG: hypothetical protein K8H77_04710, partial [Cutibacterium acnes]|nr:hypothetical protein [Cutibacterium acnes]
MSRYGTALTGHKKRPRQEGLGMRTAEIGQRFVDFFESKGHTVVPSASLLYNDPTLLFVNAG